MPQFLVVTITCTRTSSTMMSEYTGQSLKCRHNASRNVIFFPLFPFADHEKQELALILHSMYSQYRDKSNRCMNTSCGLTDDLACAQIGGILFVSPRLNARIAHFIKLQMHVSAVMRGQNQFMKLRKTRQKLHNSWRCLIIYPASLPAIRSQVILEGMRAEYKCVLVQNAQMSWWYCLNHFC